MSKKENLKALLDEKLQERAVTGLRVADCVVMPALHGGHVCGFTSSEKLIVMEGSSNQLDCAIREQLSMPKQEQT